MKARIIKPIYEYVPLKELNLLHRFSILAFIPIMIIVLLLGTLASYYVIEETMRSEAEHTEVHTKILSGKFLTKYDFDANNPQRVKAFDSLFTSVMKATPEYKRIKIYDKKGTIIWSDVEKLINLNFYDSNSELRKALGGETMIYFGELMKKENVHEKQFGKGFEIYVPVVIDGDVIGVIEMYRIPEVLLGNIRKSVIITWIVSILGGLFIYFSLYWIVKSSYNHQLELEKKVFESKDRLENLIDGIRDGIALIDTNYSILTANRSFAERFGITIKEILGRNIMDYIHDDLDEKCGKQCEKGHTASFDIELSGSGKAKKRFINITCFPLTRLEKEGYITDDSNYQAVVVLRDVTREKELTRELVRSEKLATIGTLFPKISHEIKNPLNALELGLITLKEKYPKENIIDLIMSSKDNILRISNDLLAFSRVRKEEHAIINVNDVMKGAVYFLRETTGQIKYHTINEDYKNTLPIKGIYEQLEQLFINLILNASQAMEEKPLAEQVLSVGTYEVDEHVVAYVRDKGAGIKKEYYDNIFEHFFTTKKEGKGTGLGMAIVSEIAQKHGATVTFESEVDKGTTFFVSFKSVKLDRKK